MHKRRMGRGLVDARGLIGRSLDKPQQTCYTINSGQTLKEWKQELIATVDHCNNMANFWELLDRLVKV